MKISSVQNHIHLLIHKMVSESRKENCRIIQGMPDVAKTKNQKLLQTKHGTPKQFATACVNAIGDISPLEALVAIRKYERKWRNSK